MPAYEEGLRNVPRYTEVLVIDAPARVHGTELNELVRRAETIIVPVLPSSDRHEGLRPFHGGTARNRQSVAQAGAASRVVANRVREYTLIYEELDQYLVQAEGSLSGLSARGAELRARVCARHGRAGAAGVSGLAGLEAVGAHRRVARQQAKQP